MEYKICPILGAGPVEINSACKMERCALWNESAAQCSISVIAVELQSASANTGNLADTLAEIGGEIPDITNAVKGLV